MQVTPAANALEANVLAAKSAAAVAEESHVEYVCPMDPEVRQLGPGSCPICGMALEPETISAEEADNPELVTMRRRFWAKLAGRPRGMDSLWPDRARRL